MNEPPRALADLRFRFGVYNLKPKTFWHCEFDPGFACTSPCLHAGAKWNVHSEDGKHVTLEREHDDQ